MNLQVLAAYDYSFNFDMLLNHDTPQDPIPTFKTRESYYGFRLAVRLCPKAYAHIFQELGFQESVQQFLVNPKPLNPQTVNPRSLKH